MRLIVARLLLACSAGTAIALACESAPTNDHDQSFRSSVVVVPVDVRVTDRAGRPVSGLKREDFTIREEGVQQEISVFEPYEIAPAEKPRNCVLPPTPIAENSVGPHRGRVFLIAIERTHLPEVRFGGVEAVAAFLRQDLLPQDYAALSIAGRMTDITCDHESLAVALEQWRAFQATLGTSARVAASRVGGFDKLYEQMAEALDTILAPVSRAKRLLPKPEREFAGVLEAIQRRTGSRGSGARALDVFGSVEALRNIEGEKHLIYPFAFVGAFPSTDDDRSVARVASDARVAVHFISANGLSLSSSSIDREQSMASVASRTGGSAFFDQQMAGALGKIEQSTRRGYRLGYSPSSPRTERAMRRIGVELRSGIDGRASFRQSYRDRDALPTADVQTFFAQDTIMDMAERGESLPQFGLDAVGANRGQSVELQLSVDLRKIAIRQIDGRFVGKIEIAVFCTNRAERLVGQQWTTVNLNLQEETLARLSRDGLTQRLSVPVSSTARFAKVVVFDYGVGAAGSKVISVR